MDQDVLAEWKARDPLRLLRKKLSKTDAAKIEKLVETEIEEAIEFAKNSPEPSKEEFLESLVD